MPLPLERAFLYWKVNGTRLGCSAIGEPQKRLYLGLGPSLGGRRGGRANPHALPNAAPERKMLPSFMYGCKSRKGGYNGSRNAPPLPRVANGTGPRCSFWCPGAVNGQFQGSHCSPFLCLLTFEVNLDLRSVEASP